MPTTYSPFVAELKEKMEFEGPFLVKVIQLHMDKNGAPLFERDPDGSHRGNRSAGVGKRE